MKNLALPRAADVCSRIEIGLETHRPMDEEDTLQVVDRLAADDKLYEAVKVLANALSKPAAVWWAHNCVREALAEGSSEKHKAALHSVETWVREPTEPNRRACFKAAESAGFDSAAGCAAMAAFGSVVMLPSF